MKKIPNTIINVYKLAIVIASVIAFLLLYMGFYDEAFLANGGVIILVLLYSFIIICFAEFFKAFAIGRQKVRECIFGYMLAITFADVILYLILSMMMNRLLNPLPIILLAVIQLVIAVIMYYYAHKIYIALKPRQKVVLIYSDEAEGNFLKFKFDDSFIRYDVEAMISQDAGIDAIEKAMSEYSAAAIGRIDENIKKQILELSYKNNKKLFMLPSESDIISHRAELRMVDDMPMYLCREHEGRMYEFFAVKRFFDIILSIIALILLSIPLLVSMIAIAMEDGTPVFYRQTRLTKGGKEFRIIKLRSMVKNAEELTGPVLTHENDPRITKTGKWLRRLHFDEIPQLINILKGDMSFVGPRPERPEMYNEIEKSLPNFPFRLKIKAGLTGYAQLYGKYNTRPEDKLRLDIYYVENANFFMDLSLIIYTVKKCIFGEVNGFNREPGMNGMAGTDRASNEEDENAY